MISQLHWQETRDSRPDAAPSCLLSGTWEQEWVTQPVSICIWHVILCCDWICHSWKYVVCVFPPCSIGVLIPIWGTRALAHCHIALVQLCVLWTHCSGVNSTASTTLPRHGPSGPAGFPSFEDLSRTEMSFWCTFLIDCWTHAWHRWFGLYLNQDAERGHSIAVHALHPCQCNASRELNLSASRLRLASNVRFVKQHPMNFMTGRKAESGCLQAVLLPVYGSAAVWDGVDAKYLWYSSHTPLPLQHVSSFYWWVSLWGHHMRLGRSSIVQRLPAQVLLNTFRRLQCIEVSCLDMFGPGSTLGPLALTSIASKACELYTFRSQTVWVQERFIHICILYIYKNYIELYRIIRYHKII